MVFQTEFCFGIFTIQYYWNDHSEIQCKEKFERNAGQTLFEMGRRKRAIAGSFSEVLSQRAQGGKN